MNKSQGDWSPRFKAIQEDPKFKDLVEKLSPEDREKVLQALQDLVTRVERTVLDPFAKVVTHLKTPKNR